MSDYYHLEFQKNSDTWLRFTKEPVLDPTTADNYLKVVKAFAEVCDINVERVRVRRLTATEVVDDQIAMLTQEEREAIVVQHIQSLPPGEFWRQVQAARERAKSTP
jgi:hypothetical protein